MGNRGRWLFAGVVVCAAVAWGSPARADIPLPPYSYRHVSPDGLHVFVMIAPVPTEEDPEGWSEEMADGIREIRRLYTRSGLYQSDGSAEPLWTVDWYAHSVEVASDGVHLIRHGPWASSTGQEALSFFAEGRLLRTYQIRELVDLSLMLRRTASHFFWKKRGRFDDARLEYSLETMDGNRFVFDVRTGEVVSAHRPARAILVGAHVVVGALVIVILARVVVRRRRP